MKLISNDTYTMHWRFNELVELVNKTDGRRELTFEDQGYVEDVDLFLTGCISGLPIKMYLDGSSVNWKLLNCPKQFKTMLDFYNGIIKCQGKFISEIEGYMRHNFIQSEIRSEIISSGASAEDKKELIKYFKM